MSSDLVELTNTELDAVSGGKQNLLAMNFGNIITQVNIAENIGVVVNGNLTQTLNNNNNNNITGNTMNPTNSGTFSFGNFNFSI
jgi:hypothetical protein